VAEKIREWRQVSKLNRPETDALPTYVHPQTLAFTPPISGGDHPDGLSSNGEPNLQNLPVRTQTAENPRAFIEPPGHKLVRRSADYSQSIAAARQIADSPVLKPAFRDRASTFTP